jgi:ATP-dependent Clp protease ATP-binding subunit ClpB
MDLNKYTQKSREAIATAQSLAAEMHHQEITGKHLFVALLEQDGGMIPRIIEHTGIESSTLLREARELLARTPGVHGYETSLRLGSGLARVLGRAEKEAKDMKDQYVSVEHLLLALLEDSENELKEMLRQIGLNRSKLFASLHSIRGNQQVTSENPEETYEALEKYGRDLTKLAQDGKLDPVIGRDDEIRRAIEILSRRTKNNPVLIGEPGVGKTAIVEGLARRIVAGMSRKDLKTNRSSL